MLYIIVRNSSIYYILTILSISLDLDIVSSIIVNKIWTIYNYMVLVHIKYKYS